MVCQEQNRTEQNSNTFHSEVLLKQQTLLWRHKNNRKAVRCSVLLKLYTESKEALEILNAYPCSLTTWLNQIQKQIFHFFEQNQSLWSTYIVMYGKSLPYARDMIWTMLHWPKVSNWQTQNRSDFRSRRCNNWAHTVISKLLTAETWARFLDSHVPSGAGKTRVYNWSSIRTRLIF